MKVNDRITAQDWFQDVGHIELDLENVYRHSPSCSKHSSERWDGKILPTDVLKDDIET